MENEENMHKREWEWIFTISTTENVFFLFNLKDCGCTLLYFRGPTITCQHSN